MGIFVRLTVTIAVVLVGIVVALFILKLVAVAGVIAAVGIALLFLLNFFRGVARSRDVAVRR